MLGVNRHIIVHGHFYQPPREDPWTGRIPRQPGAAPYHDWNARIHAECYRANAFARIHGADGRIVRIVNNFERMSFNVGPTLFGWIERHDPATYARILAGRENALAQPFVHAILPLCNDRDRATLIRWGIADYRGRFGRDPAGMWLPETAADTATLRALAAEGVRFTVLAPSQMKSPVEPTRPYRCEGVAVFFYHGAVAHDVGFGTLLSDGRAFADRLAGASGPVVSIATDGETFGHHKKFGDLSLAYALFEALTPSNFEAALRDVPPEADARIHSPSAWSCAHGVGRWERDCGCRIAGGSQKWRRPLRRAIHRLRDRLARVFEEEGRCFWRDPWKARDAMPRRDGRAGELLEMQRQMLMAQTSCAWFFDEPTGIETTQNLHHAARAIELSRRPRLRGLFERDLGRRIPPIEHEPDPESILGALSPLVEQAQAAGIDVRLNLPDSRLGDAVRALAARPTKESLSRVRAAVPGASDLWDAQSHYYEWFRNGVPPRLRAEAKAVAFEMGFVRELHV